MVGSRSILSSGNTVTGSCVLNVFIVAEHSIIPTWSAASVWSTSKEFGSASGLDRLYGVVWLNWIWLQIPSAVVWAVNLSCT